MQFIRFGPVLCFLSVQVVLGEEDRAALSAKVAEMCDPVMQLKWCCSGQVAVLVPVGDEPEPDDSQVQLVAESARTALCLDSGDLVVLHCSARSGRDEVYNSTEWRNKVPRPLQPVSEGCNIPCIPPPPV